MMTTQTNETTNPIRRFFNGSVSINWEVVLYITIFLVAIFTRFHILGDRVMSHDESLHTKFAYDLYAEGNFSHTPLMHGPILFHAEAASYALFGDNDFSARIYTAFLGVLLVMSPLLFRRWLGRWGTILACTLLLISPLIMYYNRYIRHDTPSIFSALLMIWAIMMYLNGPPNQQRRAHWLYVIAVAMIWNLGSKETAFIYIAIIGIFLFLYWLVRLVQHFFGVSGKRIFYTGMIGTLVGGVTSLGMYIIFDIIQFDLLPRSEANSFGMLPMAEQTTFAVWTGLIIGVMLLVVFSTLLWAYRDAVHRINWMDVLSVLGIAALVCLALVVFEELSHLAPVSTETAEPSVPGEGGGASGAVATSLSWLPMIAVWVVGLAGTVFAVVTRLGQSSRGDEKGKSGSGFWGTMDLFPEFDLIIVIGALILPWATALIPFAMSESASDWIVLGESLQQTTPWLYDFINNYIPQIAGTQQVGQAWAHFLAFVPLAVFSWAMGLAWNWKRWLISWAIFHVIFAFFFTTVFTNIAGLATGKIYSLGYWLEQQGERRGSQPQYYYLLIIMPMYEFLPVIGGVASMFAGLNVFWRYRRDEDDEKRELEMAILEADVLDSERSNMDVDYRIHNGMRVAMPADVALSPLEYYDGEIPDDKVLGEATDDDMERIEMAKNNAKKQRDAQLRVDRLIGRRESALLNGIPFLILFAWLGVLNLVGYSLAGEKMPWLGTHLTLPLIFLTAWYFGRTFDKIDWQTFKERGWMLLAVLTLAFIALVQVILPLVMGVPPFSGLATVQLNVTYSWLAALLVFAVAVGVSVYLTLETSWSHLRRLLAVTIFGVLSIVTFRAAWMASFINYDYPNEFLVYAHAAPAVKTVLNEIEELSLRITDGYDLKVAYDNEVSWPYSWYFREYPNAVYIGENPTTQNLQDAIAVVVGPGNRGDVEAILQDRYQRFEHQRMWWPMQEYFYLTADRVQNTLAATPESAQIRQGIWDIWWSRDYSTYGEAIDKDFSLTNWPVSDRMYFYVRKDYAAQIWSYGVGEGTVANPLEEIDQNQCNANVLTVPVEMTMQAPDGLTNPVGLSIDDDGTLYVAEEYGHEISVFDADGNFVRAIGQQGTPDVTTSTDENSDAPVLLNRPNSVAVDDAGNLYIADTWNWRILVLNSDGEQIASFGQPGTYGFDAPQEPTDAFWGPRDVVFNDETGRLYISDTGNKRIRVYEIMDGEAVWIDDLSSGGSGMGQVDEPAGLAISDDGKLYVADMWNRRIGVYTVDGGFFENYDVRGWFEREGSRPYVTLDEDRGIMYVTDPDAGRVLVYTLDGECVGSFGNQPTETGEVPLGIASGVAVDGDGFVYVTDNERGQVVKFAPFPQTEPPAPQEDGEADSANDGREDGVSDGIVNDGAEEPSE